MASNVKANGKPRTPKGIKQHTIERIALDQMHPATYNPRKITPKNKEALRSSMRRFGNLQPVVWNRRSGNIVGGHQRYDLHREAGDAATDAVVVDVGPAEEKAMNIALNARTVTGVFDDERLDALLKDIESDDKDLFRDLNLGDLLKPLDIPKDLVEEDEVEEAPARGRPQAVVSYQIVFDDDAQLQRWYKFLGALRKWYPDEETIGARVTRYVEEALAEQEPTG
jgi:ParB-like chromosome segregation protein Spo0J